MLLEVFFRWSILIFADKFVIRGNQRSDGHRIITKTKESSDDWAEVTNSQSMYLFIGNILIPFHKKLMFSW